MKKIYLSLLILLAASAINAATWYVKPSVESTAWADKPTANVKISLNDAFVAAAANDEIWFSAGTHYHNGNAGVAVALNKNIKIYGSFAGTETSIADRAKVANGSAWDFAHPTYIEPAAGYSVSFTTVGGGQTIVIDGFVFQKFKGTNAAVLAIRQNTTVENCKFFENANTTDGGGISIYPGGNIINCCFKKNRAASSAGVFANMLKQPIKISGCLFEENTSTGTANGGAALNIKESGGQDASSSALVSDCIFRNNICEVGKFPSIVLLKTQYGSIENSLIINNVGRAVDIIGGGKIANLTIANNVTGTTAGDSCAVFVSGSGKIYNTIIWGNKLTRALSQSQGISFATGASIEVANVACDVDTLSKLSGKVKDYYLLSQKNVGEAVDSNYVKFVAPTSFVGPSTSDDEKAALLAAKFNMAGTSVVIDKGNNDFIDGSIIKDLAGGDRFQGARIDIGAYEVKQSTPVAYTTYLVETGSGSGTDKVWRTAGEGEVNVILGDTKLNEWIAANAKAKDQVWLAAGEYKTTGRVDIKGGVAYYGGFAGTETELAERVKSDLDQNGTVDSWEYAHQSILSAQATVSGMFTCLNMPVNSFADGLVIQGGIQNQTAAAGAILTGSEQTPTTIINSIIRKNRVTGLTATAYAGGLRLTAYSTAKSCLIEENIMDDLDVNGVDRNTKASYGAGVKLDAATALLVNSVVRNNQNLGGGGGNCQGGGIYSTGTVRNCLLYNNVSNGRGGGIYVANNATAGNAVDYCTIVNNKAITNTGGGVYLYGTNGNGDGLRNSIIWNNFAATASNSNIWVETKTTPNIKIGSVAFNGNSAMGTSFTQLEGTKTMSNLPDADVFVKPTATIGYIENASAWDCDWRLVNGKEQGLDFGVRILPADQEERDFADTLRSYPSYLGAYEYIIPPTTVKVFLVETGLPGDQSWRDATGAEKNIVLNTEVNNNLALWLKNQTFESGMEVWLAGGTYDISETITLLPQVHYIGGFAGTEETIADRQRSDRDGNTLIEPWEFDHLSIVNAGTIQNRDNARCMIMQKAGTDMVVDGLVLQNADMLTANATGLHSNNAENSFIRNSIIRNNKARYIAGAAIWGAGLQLTGTTIADGCLIEGNTSESTHNANYGAGVDMMANSMIKNSVIRGNSNLNTGARGGGLRLRDNAIARNCIVYNNYSQDRGAGIYIDNAPNASVEYCTVVKNATGRNDGQGIYINTNGSVYNSIVMDNFNTQSTPVLCNINNVGTIYSLAYNGAAPSNLDGPSVAITQSINDVFALVSEAETGVSQDTAKLKSLWALIRENDFKVAQPLTISGDEYDFRGQKRSNPAYLGAFEHFTLVDVENTLAESFKVYGTTIDSPAGTLCVYTTAGQLVQSFNKEEGAYRLNLHKGIYLLKLVSDQGLSMTQKMFVK